MPGIPSSILIVDDDPMTSKLLSDVLVRMGHRTAVAATLKEGLEAVYAHEFDLILLDVGLPDGNGLEALPDFVATKSRPEVIIITGAGDVNGAELAIKSGAWDYLEKPPSRENISLSISRALQYRESRKSHASRLVALNLEGFVGKSPGMREVLDLIASAATSHANVLITGETGTGKELVAQAIHRNSLRASRTFVVLDCSVLPDTLVESMLFGHEKGSFTGADRYREGIVKQADGGTLFLDEVGELSLPAQKAFLRVLQERRFRPLGGRAELSSDFRLIAATNRNLEEMVKEGRFREDLLFRLNTFTIQVPSLRERQSDIKELVTFQVSRLSERHGIGSKGCSPDFFKVLECYPWPGNVRELFHVVERAVAMAGYEPVLFSKHLPNGIRVHFAKAALGKGTSVEEGAKGAPRQLAAFPNLKDYRKAMDLQYLQDLMTHCRGNIKEACRKSGLSQSRLYELLKIHEIPV